jgi:hypothetical protein
MKKLLIALTAIVVLVGLCMSSLGPNLPREDREVSVESESDGLRTEFLFTCAEGKRMMLVLQDNEGKLVLDDGRLVALQQVPRADEAEGDSAGYASADGATRLILNSGFATSAFLEEEGVTTYAECTALAGGTEALEVALHQGAWGGEVYIEPLEIAEESRCAIDVVCIQAGTVRLRAMVKIEDREMEHIFELGRAVVIEDYEMGLSSVLPAPRAGEAIDPNDYRFYFSIGYYADYDPGDPE